MTRPNWIGNNNNDSKLTHDYDCQEPGNTKHTYKMKCQTQKHIPLPVFVSTQEGQKEEEKKKKKKKKKKEEVMGLSNN